MRDKYLKEMLKQSGALKCTMNPLTLDEAVLILKYVAGVPESTARELYVEWGGSLRHLLRAFRGLLDVNDEDRMKAFHILGLYQTGVQKNDNMANLVELTDKEKFPGHYILHEWRTEPGKPRTVQYRPASEKVARLLHEGLLKQGFSALASFVNRLHPSCPQYWWAFEDLTHVSLSTGGEFYLRSSLPQNLPNFTQSQLDGFAGVCTTFPFDFNNKKKINQVFNTQMETAKDAQRQWKGMDRPRKQRLMQKGVNAKIPMKRNCEEHLRYFAHTHTEALPFSLPQMTTVFVRDMDDVQPAIREWKELSADQPCYFKPEKHVFPGIDSFALVPELASNVEFQSQLVVFQAYAGSSTEKLVKRLGELMYNFEKAGVLKSEERLNFVIVQPRGQLRHLVTLDFETDVDTDRVQQWTLGLL